MATVFTTWAAELLRWKNALANRDADSFWIMSTENSREMKTVYTRLGNIAIFTTWLEDKAEMEALSDEDGRGGDSVSILQAVSGSD
jgi:hypothetical protein